MNVELVRPRLLSVGDFHRMIEAGILGPEERVELVEGELIAMAAIGARHAHAVGRLTMRLSRSLPDSTVLWVQNPVQLDAHTEVYPDLAVISDRDYGEEIPEPHDVLLVIEVSDTTLGYDQGKKVPLYARHGVPEVWIVNLAKGVIEAFRQPSSDSYDEIRRYGPGDTIAPALLPECAIRVGEILG